MRDNSLFSGRFQFPLAFSLIFFFFLFFSSSPQRKLGDLLLFILCWTEALHHAPYKRSPLIVFPARLPSSSSSSSWTRSRRDRDRQVCWRRRRKKTEKQGKKILVTSFAPIYISVSTTRWNVETTVVVVDAAEAV